MKIAFVFPGQGSQHVGMGKDLYDGFEEVRALYADATEALGYDVAGLCFNGPKDELDTTVRTQPCLLTTGYAAFTAVTLRGIRPFCMAGHSLGEYTAVAASGVIDFRQAVALTEQRGRFMQEAVPEGAGLMAAIIGLERDDVERLCGSVSNGYVAPANFNCPGQIVVAGEREAVGAAMKRADGSGAKRAVPLAVSVPSHCRLMSPASDHLARILDGMEFREPGAPVVNNADAVFLYEAEEIRRSLLRQLNSPLLWEDSVRCMIGEGVDTFIELGPKRVLSGLIRRIDRDVKIFNVEDTKSLEETVKAIA